MSKVQCFKLRVFFFFSSERSLLVRMRHVLVCLTHRLYCFRLVCEIWLRVVSCLYLEGIVTHIGLHGRKKILLEWKDIFFHSSSFWENS